MVSDKTVGMVIGFGLGFASCYILIKTGTITVSMDKTSTQKKYGAMNTDTEQYENPLAGWKPLDNIPTVDRIDAFQPIPVNNMANNVEEQATAPGTVRYKNKEKMKVIRGPDKRIVGYETDRDAKISE